MLGPPREDGDGIRFGMEPNVYSVIAAEARYIRSVDRIALFERSVELSGLDGDILLYAENIAESKADELLSRCRVNLSHIKALKYFYKKT